MVWAQSLHENPLVPKFLLIWYLLPQTKQTPKLSVLNVEPNPQANTSLHSPACSPMMIAGHIEELRGLGTTMTGNPKTRSSQTLRSLLSSSLSLLNPTKYEGFTWTLQCSSFWGLVWFLGRDSY